MNTKHIRELYLVYQTLFNPDGLIFYVPRSVEEIQPHRSIYRPAIMEEWLRDSFWLIVYNITSMETDPM